MTNEPLIGHVVSDSDYEIDRPGFAYRQRQLFDCIYGFGFY